MIPATASLRSRLPPTVREYARLCVTVDSRSLALFRIVVATLIIMDVVLRSRNFHFYYTDDGVVPQALAESHRSVDTVSIFFFTSDPTAIALLFVAGVVVAVALLIGYNTRIAMVGSFLFVISVDHHNPLVLSYADTLFRMLLFWAMFLPLGERWSIDALQRGRSPRASVASVATAAIVIQMVFMYFINALNKYPSHLWHSGEAAILVMGIDEMTFLLGNAMRAVPSLLQIGGTVWFHIMLFSPLLILLYGRARYPQLLLFLGGHASFAVTVRIGAFPYVAIAGLIVFFQPQLWSDAKTMSRMLAVDGRIRPIGERIERFGTTLATVLPGPTYTVPERSSTVRVGISALVIVAMVGLFVLPAFSMAAEGPVLEENPLPEADGVDELATAFGVSQPPWGIFAGPGPRSVDRYYVFPARTADGDVIDVYNDRPMTYDRPGRNLQEQHSTYRERFYMNSIRRSGQTGQAAQLYADHICETWRTDDGVGLTHVNMYEVTEVITVDTIDAPDERSRSISQMSRHGCGDRDPIDILPPVDRDEIPPAERS